MTCEKALQLLEPALENDLEGDDVAEFRRHVEGCASCAAELTRAKQFLDCLETLHLPDPPADLPDRVKRSVRHEAERMARARLISWSCATGLPILLAVFVHFFFPGGFGGFWRESATFASGLWEATLGFVSGSGREGLVGKLPQNVVQDPKAALGVTAVVLLLFALVLYRYWRVASWERSRS